MFAFDPHLKDPRVYQWNVTGERSLGISRSFEISYVGNQGDDLLRRNVLTPAMGGNSDFIYLDVVTNDAWSNYNALQAQFKQRPWHGLQLIASYTWAHAIDNGSSVNLPNPYTNVYNPDLDRGNSDFDMRHDFSTALGYEVPGTHGENRPLGTLTNGWALASIFRANSAVPVNVTTGDFGFGLSGNPDSANQRPQHRARSAFLPLWFRVPRWQAYQSGCLRGLRLRSFTQGDLPRNALRGFGA